MKLQQIILMSARYFCNELFLHDNIILTGKNVETLQKMITHVLNECIYYQPAVLVLDDLGSIAGVGSATPGDEETIYFTR